MKRGAMASAARSFSKSSSCYFHLSFSSLRPCLMSEAVDVGSLSWSVQLGLFLYMITRRLIIPTAASLQPSVTLDREKRWSLFFLPSFCLPYFFVLFFYLVFPPQLGVLSQVQSRDVFPGSLVQIGVACCHLCVRAYSDQQVQRRPSGQPSDRAATSPFDNDVFAFSSWCLQFYQQVSNLWWSHTHSIFSLRSAVITFWCRTASPCQSSRFTFNTKLRY